MTRHAEVVATVLGSCVSACIRDTRIRVGGMNHFMLPLDASQGTSAWGAAASAATRYGNVAMERLINDILKLGGRREDLEIKLVGGGRVLADMTTDIGARNIEFVRQYVQDEGFKVVGEDLGDIYPAQRGLFSATPAACACQALLGGDATSRWRSASATTSTSSTANRSEATSSCSEQHAMTSMQTGTHANPGNIVRPEARVREFTRACSKWSSPAITSTCRAFPKWRCAFAGRSPMTRSSIDQVVRMVSAEPSLAVRLLQLAQLGGAESQRRRLTDLRAAITRIGFNMARSATIAFAMSQLRRAEATRDSKSRSTSSGATARRWRR